MDMYLGQWQHSGVASVVYTQKHFTNSFVNQFQWYGPRWFTFRDIDIHSMLVLFDSDTSFISTTTFEKDTRLWDILWSTACFWASFMTCVLHRSSSSIKLSMTELYLRLQKCWYGELCGQIIPNLSGLDVFLGEKLDYNTLRIQASVIDTQTHLTIFLGKQYLCCDSESSIKSFSNSLSNSFAKRIFWLKSSDNVD